MNELTPNQSAPQPSQATAQSRGITMPYAAYAGASAVNTNFAVADRVKSFQSVPRGTNLSTAKYQPRPQQLQQLSEYHAASYALQKSPADTRSGKFDYANQSYSLHPAQPQQSYVAPYGYSTYAQSYGNTGDFQHQHHPAHQHQQHYHSGYAQVETNALGMLVSSATNPQASDAMPHEPVNIGHKDAGHRKYRQSYNVVPNDSFLSSSGGYVHNVERRGNVVQIKPTLSNTQQSLYQHSNLYGNNTAYYSQQQQVQQQRTQETTPLSASYDANSNGSVSIAMGQGMNNGSSGMFTRMPQYSSNASGPSLTTRLKDGGVDVSTGASSSGSHLPFMQHHHPAAKSLELTHPTSIYADVTNPTTSMSMVSLSSDRPGTASVNANALYPPSLVPPSSQHHTSTEDTCGLCSGVHSDRIADHCGHRFHAQCLHSWGGMTTCPICAQASNTITSLPQTSTVVGYGLGGDNISIAQNSAGEIPMNGGGGISDNTATNNSVTISPNPMDSSQVTTIHTLQANSGGRPPPIDTRVIDSRVGATSLNGSKRSATSTRSESSNSGRVRKNKKLKDCSVPGCDRTVRSRGLCKGHGGGRRCGFSGCGLSDQGGGFCISHGGGKRCQHDRCDNSAQSRGLCKLHGGGSRCTVPNCTKSSQGRGLCRAHGGGRRCMVEGCNKTDRRAGYCVTHGADKKCIIAECSKTGRIDSMCTKHYFERHPAQPPGMVSTTPPPIITVNANTSAARARAERKRAAEQQAAAAHYTGMSSVMLVGSTTHASFDERVGGAMTKTGPY